MLQPLKKDGRPNGKSVISVEGKSINPMDISNPLPGGKRYLLYTNEGTPGEAPLLLQVLDAKTLGRIGDPIRIVQMGSTYQGVVIDPSGRFLLYHKAMLDDSLVYQALDATGHPSGQPKVISEGNFQLGLDILKD